MPASPLDEQTRQARDLFRRTGMMPELIKFNLQVWPRLLFPAGKHVKLGIDPQERVLAVTMDIPWYKRSGDVRKQAAKLHDSVMALLGGDFETVVSINGKVIFRGTRLSPVVAGDYTGTDFEAGRIVPETPWNFKKPSPSSPPSNKPKPG